MNQHIIYEDVLENNWIALTLLNSLLALRLVSMHKIDYRLHRVLD
jgi:hypothetical protein